MLMSHQPAPKVSKQEVVWFTSLNLENTASKFTTSGLARVPSQRACTSPYVAKSSNRERPLPLTLTQFGTNMAPSDSEKDHSASKKKSMRLFVL